MKILSIETSCDETAVSVLEGNEHTITVLGNALASQIELHAQYGGVFPALAKRAHAEKFVLLLKEALSESGMLIEGNADLPDLKEQLEFLNEKETTLKEHFLPFFSQYQKPAGVDYIAVTSGPGLEPALWVGINAAKALSTVWDIPLFPINHMEGHVVSAVFQQKNENKFSLHELSYPVLALLVSGGHTELVVSDEPLQYKKIGQTRDDAVGEAFDKVARILGLPYPGGPKISAFAKESREQNLEKFIELPRPMLHSGDYDFSFSGLKTAVLYATQKKELSENDKKSIAQEFEEAAVEVLVSKTAKAIEEFNVQTLLVGGGVANNEWLRAELTRAIKEQYPQVTLLFPTKDLTTDNSVMIGMTLYYQLLHEKNKKTASNILKADGNLSF